MIRIIKILTLVLSLPCLDIFAGSSNQTAADCLIRGREYQTLGKLSEAQQAYSLAIKKDPDCADAYSNLGVIYYSQNSYALAKKMFEKALEFDPNLTEARQNLGVVYYATGRVEKAIDLWRKALTMDQHYYDRPRLHLFIGIAYLFSPEIVKLDDFIRLAILEFDKAMVSDSAFAEAHYWKGKALELVPDISGAMIEYMQATTIDKCYAEAYNQWGILLYTRENYGLAWDKFNKAIFCDPDNANYHYNLGLSYSARMMNPEAEEEFRKALKLNPYIDSSDKPIMIHTRKTKPILP
ncbi:MAG: tetratricopeptide repeat protein [Candidatus Zixiibacteriota bacterium]